MSEEVEVTQHVITRAEWGAKPPKSRKILRDTTSPTLHWNGPSTGLERGSSQEAEEKYLRGVQHFHMNDRGWADIAYSFAVAPSGRVYELRGWKIRTAANGTTKGNDSSHAFLLMIGEGDEITQEMIDSTRRLRALGDSKYVKAHRDWKSTACPGEEIARLIRANAFEGLPDDDKTEEPTAPIDVPAELPTEKVYVKVDTSGLHHSHMLLSEVDRDLSAAIERLHAAFTDIDNFNREN